MILYWLLEFGPLVLLVCATVAYAWTGEQAKMIASEIEEAQRKLKRVSASMDRLRGADPPPPTPEELAWQEIHEIEWEHGLRDAP